MRYLTWREVADRLTVSVSTAKRLHANDPDFPPKVPISPGRVGFLENKADAYVAILAERARVAA